MSPKSKGTQTFGTRGDLFKACSLNFEKIKSKDGPEIEELKDTHTTSMQIAKYPEESLEDETFTKIIKESIPSKSNPEKELKPRAKVSDTSM